MITPKTKIIFLCSLSFLIATAGALGWVLYSVAQAGSDLEEYVVVIANKTARESKLKELTELVKDTESEREALQQFILTEEETIAFLADIETIGREQGIILTTDSLKEVKNTDGQNQLKINFTVTGTETLVLRMMQILETVPYHSELSSVDITTNATRDKATMKVKLTVSLSSV